LFGGWLDFSDSYDSYSDDDEDDYSETEDEDYDYTTIFLFTSKGAMASVYELLLDYDSELFY